MFDPSPPSLGVLRLHPTLRSAFGRSPGRETFDRPARSKPDDAIPESRSAPAADPARSARVSQSEQVLIRHAQAGDLPAFERLMEANADRVYHLALRLLGDPQEAEDLAQEAMLRAWNGLPRFRADSAFSTWLYRITTNLCYNRLPRLKQELRALEDERAWAQSDGQQRPEFQLAGRELGERLESAIAALPEQYRLLITLRHLDDLSYAEIADLCGLPLGTVKTGIHRGRRQLQAALEDLAPAPAGRGANIDRSEAEVSHA